MGSDPHSNGGLPERRSPRLGRGWVFGVIALTCSTQPAQSSGASLDPLADAIEGTAPVAPLAASGIIALIENRRVLSYPFEQVWPTAIRYLRIDRGYSITDRDEEAGYVLFEFPLDGERTGSGSVEMFRTEDVSGRASVSVAVNTGSGPVHLPHAILDGLAAKVRAERGQPVAPPPREQPDKPSKPDKDNPDGDGSVPLLPPAQDP